MTEKLPRIQLAVVVPLYNEIENLTELHDRLHHVCRKVSEEFALIFVDDASSDGTTEALNELAANYSEVNVISLSRNFGQPAAILAGLSNSNSECSVLLDGDLQDPPELIEQMFEKWLSGAEIVIAQRKSRRERGLRGLALRSFHRVFAFLADSNITPNTGTFCLLDRKAVDSICQLPEKHRFFPGLRSWVGFKYGIVQYDRADRLHGEPKQTFRRLFKYALDGIFSFSFKPLRLMTFVGTCICACSLILATWFICKRLIGIEDASTGFTTLTCGILGLGGFQMIGMGILGEYVGRIYEEVKNRPAYFVSKKTGKHLNTTMNTENERTEKDVITIGGTRYRKVA